MDGFWACGKMKEAIQDISRNFFKRVSSISELRIVLSGCFIDSESMEPCIARRSAEMS